MSKREQTAAVNIRVRPDVKAALEVVRADRERKARKRNTAARVRLGPDMVDVYLGVRR